MNAYFGFPRPEEPRLDHYSVLSVDQKTGFASFPAPGDVKKHLLPQLEDGEERKPSSTEASEAAAPKPAALDNKDYWMPDKLCKTCYACEAPFTIFWRRHHCRLCGQVFCSSCSNYFVDGRSLGVNNTVRCCQMCHDQIVSGQLRPKLRLEQFEGPSFAAPQPDTPDGRDTDLGNGEAESKAPSVGRELDSDAHSTEEVGLPDRSAFASRVWTSKHVSVLDPQFRANNTVHMEEPPVESPEDAARHTEILQRRASKHIEDMVRHLLRLSEPKGISVDKWFPIVCNLVREVVSTVDPNVKAGDNLDIRPYVKVKVIPGGSETESVCVDGIVCRKNIAHKSMAHYVPQPRILLLRGGIEFERTSNRLSMLDTLLEQEEKYTQLLVDKIMSVRPNMILVGRAASRKAQELLVNQNVVLLQHIDQSLMERIARLTGGTILSSIDNMLSQHGDAVLGRCNRFILRKIVMDEVDDPTALPTEDVTVQACGMTHDDEFDYFAALHALRQRPRKPPVRTYVYLDGCPTDLGCTIVLRGEPKPVLKEIKTVLRFAIMVAYHLRLEVAYFNDRCVALPDATMRPKLTNYETGEPEAPESDSEDNGFEADAPILEVLESPELRRILSSSLDVDVGAPYKRELRGRGVKHRKLPNMVTPYDHQTILVNTLLIGQQNTQKTNPEVKGIRFYTNQDLALGQFLIDTCFQLSLKSAPPQGYRRTMLDHTFSFVHRTGRVDMAMHRLEGQREPKVSANASATPIMMWSFCKRCQAVVTPVVQMSEETWKMSLGKFLEITFYNRTARGRVGGCSHIMRDNHILFCAADVFAVRFEFVPIHPYSLHIRKYLKIDLNFHLGETAKLIHHIAQMSSQLFEDFYAHIAQLERAAKEAMAKRPEDLVLLQQVLEQITEEITQTSTMFGEQLARAVDKLPTANKDLQLLYDQPSEESAAEAEQKELGRPSDARPTEEDIIVRNPMVLRKLLYLRAVSWNDRIESIARVIESARRDAPATPSKDSKDGKEAPEIRIQENMFPDEVRDEPRLSTVRRSDIDFKVRLSEENLASRPDSAPSLTPAGSDDGLFERMSSAGASDVSDAMSDVARTVNSGLFSDSSKEPSLLDSPRPVPDLDSDAVAAALSGEEGDEHESTSGTSSQTGTDQIRAAAAAPGTQSKRVKIANALGRLLGRVTVDVDPKFRVPLGELGEGRPGLETGMGGQVVLVYENQLTSVIAHTLASVEYNALLKQMQHVASAPAGSATPPERRESTSQDVAPLTLEREPTDASAKSLDMEQHGDELSSPTKGAASALLTQPASELLESNPLSSDSAPLSESDGGDPPATDEPANPPSRGLRATMLSGEQPIFLNTGGEAAEQFAHGNEQQEPATGADVSAPASPDVNENVLERQLLSTHKSHIKYRFGDPDGSGANTCKFLCHVYWATQFSALRQAYLDEESDEGFIRSLASSSRWDAQGGKSGATFSKTSDGRFIVKQISRTELQMFLDFAPSYFNYMSRALFHNLPTVLCKILGVYQVGYHNRSTGKKVMEQVVVMDNLFYNRSITRTFDLKGSSRARYVELQQKLADDEGFDRGNVQEEEEDEDEQDHEESVQKSDDNADGQEGAQTGGEKSQSERLPHVKPTISQVLMDDNLMELTKGRPVPLKHRAKVYFHKAILNDTLFLSHINIVDYSILVGFDENSSLVVAGIIDYMRQYDIIKRMERVGKSVGMIAGQAEPTVIQPPQYRKRFQAAMERYFMTVPDKWTNFSS